MLFSPPAFALRSVSFDDRFSWRNFRTTLATGSLLKRSRAALAMFAA
jgi:hypothetical protein